MASDASIARNLGSPRARAVAAMASEVILLSSGPTAMNASRVGSRASSSILSVPNCVSATLSASTPEALKMTRSNAGVRRHPADHADPVPCEIGDLLDFRRGRSFGTIARKSGRRPQHNEVLAHDGDGLRVGRHLQIATTDRKIGVASTKQGEGFDRSVGRDRRQPHSPAFAGEGLGHHLNHFLIVASRRSDGNPES